jgi:hypothetical protein
MSKMLGAGKFSLNPPPITINLHALGFSHEISFALGSFGDVWMAVQRETGSHRAVKVTKSTIF